MHAPDFWYRIDARSQILAGTLSSLGWLYGASVAWKAANARPFRSKAKIVCVGNLTVGGTGKTPVAIAVAEMLAGRKVNFLSRGYGGKTKGPLRVTSAMTADQVGDEPLLLAQTAPTIVSRDRGAGARLADTESIDVIIMDDGHQNFSLAKDLSLVVVDMSSGFGNGRVVPAGPLREPVVQGLARADALILINNEGRPLPALPIPVLCADLEMQPVPELKGERVVAFAGIGRPQKFFDGLPGLGVTVEDTESFGDHHFYTASEIARLKARAKNLNARLVTTEKDYVRLSAAERARITAISVRAVFSEPAVLRGLLDRL